MARKRAPKWRVASETGWFNTLVTMNAEGRLRILFFVPADLEGLRRKGVADMISARTEDGFFERVFTIHPFSLVEQRVQFDDSNEVIEFATGRFVRAGTPSVLRVLGLIWHILRVVIAARRLVRRENVQLIRATDPYWMGLLGWITSRMTGVPFCISLHSDYGKRHELDSQHGAPKLFGSRALAERLERFILRRSDLVMPIRKTLGDYAVARGVKPDRIHVIPHGVDFDAIQSTPPAELHCRFAISADKKILSFAGRIVKENYVDDVVGLARRLAKRKDCVIIMAGGGSEENRLQKIVADDPELTETVRLIGFQPQEVVYSLRRASTVSLCLMGGFSLIEACAAGRPVVAYDVEWHSELVINRETGYLVREGDAEGLVQAVCDCLESPDTAKRMGQAARSLARERFSLATAVEQKRKCYRLLLS